MVENRRITYTDIAREAGVSTTAVSLVLRGMSALPEETRQRILESARRLGYLPRPSTRTLKSSVVTKIGVVVRSFQQENTLENPFYASLIGGIESACRQNNINLMFSAIPVDNESHILEIPAMLKDRQVDGILTIGVNLEEETVHEIDRFGIPLVLADAYSANSSYDSAGVANYQGGYEAVTYLVQQGHKQIAIAGCESHSAPGLVDRRRGYIQAMQDQDLTPVFINSSFDQEAVYRACDDFFSQGPQVTAVFAVSDWVAVSVLQAAGKHHLDIPADLSIMGFDDSILSVQPMFPLTTMEVDKAGMGRMAVMLLINRVENPTSALIKATLRPRLIVRDSVKFLT